MPSPPPCAPQASRSDVAGEARWDLDKVAVYQDPHTYKALDMDVVHRIVALVLANEAGRIEQDYHYKIWSLYNFIQQEYTVMVL